MLGDREYEEFLEQQVQSTSDIYSLASAPDHTQLSPGSLFVALAVGGVLFLVSAPLVVFYCKKRVNRPQVLSEELPGVVFGDIRVTEGQDIEVKCQFKLSGSKKLFCKNDCDEERNILVETSGNRAEKHRYSIQYDEETYIVTVGIKNVQLSDSGQYLCKLERFLSETWWPIDGTSEFKIEVTKARSPVKSTTPRVPPVIQTTTAVRPTHSPGPNPGPSPSPDPDCGATIRPEHEQQSEVVHGSSQTGILKETTMNSFSSLFVALAVGGVLLLVSAPLVVFYCKKRVNRPQEPHVNTGVQQIVASGHCIYQSLDLDSMDPNQTYSTLSVQQGAPPHAQQQHVQIVASGHCIYQSLNLDSIDPHQTYSTLQYSQQGAPPHAQTEI
ncbi:uncharacterized protein LOC117374167 [Periophthalmus magnuspinnatus]|uniref:uncharacterized protein LOC117374167 n=1 Tax=Periophthalmus magnuspinnatus TaxID=409849 RepID=UPI0024364D2F|nr:uncharacterized protein LOC117374167 [Periophthalmus magnuspinnatus]